MFWTQALIELIQGTLSPNIFAYSESKLTFHFVVVVLLLVVLVLVLRRKVEKDGNAKKGPFY